MPTLNSKITFDVRFLLTGTPGIQLTVNTTLTLLEQQNLLGYFAITQPDGITESGNYITPNIAWNGTALNVFIKTLRPGSNQLFQNGNYKIIFYADHPSYTPGEYMREFEFAYKPSVQSLKENFDLYTPLLKYSDLTNYAKSGYNILSQSALWTASSAAGAIPNSTGTEIDLAIAGGYYDSSYNIAYSKTVLYEDVPKSWLTILQGLSFSVTAKAYTPHSMNTLLSYLTNLKTAKDNNACNESLTALYTQAQILYSHIRSRVCAQSTIGLKQYFDEFYRLTHNYQVYLFTNTGLIIPAYDFTTGCGGSGSAGGEIYLRAPIAVSSFTVSALPAGKVIVRATRSGFTKGITASATADTEYLRIVGNVVTLPTGDIVNAVTLPDLSQVGELFTFTYN